MKTLSEREQIAKLRNLCRTDLFFLLVYGLDRHDADNQWCFERCREVQAEPDDCLDLWAREHYKSTIITFALTIQDILNTHGEDIAAHIEPVTCGIFSHTRPIAKQFLRQLKLEFERNEKMAHWFPDIFWKNPKGESPKWSEDEGIILKRKGNPKEATVEAWGLTDGQPTSKHFNRAIYDDVVTRESVTSAEMIKKTTQAWELSRNLTAIGGKSRYIGTRYAFFDTYTDIMKRGIKARIHTATVDGTVTGAPVFMPEAVLAKKRLEMQETFWAQMLMQPRAEADAFFKREWFKWYDRPTDVAGFAKRNNMRIYGASDYAVTAGGGDETVHAVVGLDPNDDLYVLDVWHGRTESHIWVERFIDLMFIYRPLVWGEENGQIIKSLGPFIDKRMRERRTYCKREQFTSASDKPSRARSFQARASMGKVFLPHQAPWIDELLMQWLSFPFGQHDDFIDPFGIIGRMLDTMVGGKVPAPELPPENRWAKAFAKRSQDDTSGSWKGR